MNILVNKFFQFFKLGLGGAIGAGLFCYSAASFAVVVSPDNLQGWVIGEQGDFVAPHEFASGPGTPTVGTGSLNIGPIGSLAANKFIVFPPISNIDVSSLASFSFDFYLNALPAKSPSQFYFNVYVDSPDNGLGVFGTFYDCRYDLVADNGLPVDTWNTVSFDANSAWTAIVNQTESPATCPATLADLPLSSKVLFIALNVGDTSLSDEGLVGAIDNAVINIDGITTQYDFEASSQTCYPIKVAGGEKVVVFCL